VGHGFGVERNWMPHDLPVNEVHAQGSSDEFALLLTGAGGWAWIGGDEGGLPTRPELANLAAKPVLCIYGAGEKDSICPSLSSAHLRSEQVGTGHHFGGEYAQLADRILSFAKQAQP